MKGAMPQKETMKVKLKDRTFDEYLESQGLNPEDLEGFDIAHIKPRGFYKRREQDLEIIQRKFFLNDLYDEQVAYESQSVSNRPRKFTEKISMSEMDELSAEELVAYHQWLIDYTEEQNEQNK